jgi:hypothetical protein
MEKKLKWGNLFPRHYTKQSIELINLLLDQPGQCILDHEVINYQQLEHYDLSHISPPSLSSSTTLVLSLTSSSSSSSPVIENGNINDHNDNDDDCPWMLVNTLETMEQCLYELLSYIDSMTVRPLTNEMIFYRRFDIQYLLALRLLIIRDVTKYDLYYTKQQQQQQINYHHHLTTTMSETTTRRTAKQETETFHHNDDDDKNRTNIEMIATSLKSSLLLLHQQ